MTTNNENQAASDLSAAAGSPDTKPPLGVTPEHIWQWQRCRELSRAIHEYFMDGREPSKEWIDELYRRFPLANGKDHEHE